MPHPDAPDPALASPLAAAEAMAEAVSAMLRIARGLIEGHRQVDLAGLDGMVGRLCARTLDLPPEQGRDLRPRLAMLVTELDALGAALPPPP